LNTFFSVVYCDYALHKSTNDFHTDIKLSTVSNAKPSTKMGNIKETSQYTDFKMTKLQPRDILCAAAQPVFKHIHDTSYTSYVLTNSRHFSDGTRLISNYNVSGLYKYKSN